MPYPAYWPADNMFMPLHKFLTRSWIDSPNTQGKVLDRPAAHKLAELQGVDEMLTKKYTPSGNYEVAELWDMTMYGLIGRQISGGPGHKAGYTQDKYLPARAIKGTPAGPGQTTGKDLKELFGKKRMEVKTGEWSLLSVLVCKNAGRWGKFEQCRQNFDRSGVDATNDFQNVTWAVTPGTQNFPLIDAKRGECWLWSGQSLDILHGIMSGGFQRIHCESNSSTGYGALGRGNYFTDKFSKALLYAMNLRNEYFGAAEGADIRVLMLSRVLLGNYRDFDGASQEERQQQRFAHNVELTGSAQRHKRRTYPQPDYRSRVQAYRADKTARAAQKKGWKADYAVRGTDVDDNIGYESAHMTHKGSNEFLVAIGKQVYPEFLVFVQKN